MGSLRSIVTAITSLNCRSVIAVILICGVCISQTPFEALSSVPEHQESLETQTEHGDDAQPSASTPLSRYFRGGRWNFNVTAYTKHFDPTPQYNNRQNTLDVEHWMDNGWLQGAAYLRNSFNQPTAYVYLGKLWRPLEDYPVAYFKLTGGILYGYKGEYKNRVPFNYRGFAPALLPSFGLAGKRFIGEILFFGLSGMFINVGVTFK